MGKQFFDRIKDYQIATCEPVIQSRRPNNRIDKVRHMFNKRKLSYYSLNYNLSSRSV